MLPSLQRCLNRVKILLFGLPAKENEHREQPEFVWCLVANIVEKRPYGPNSEETRPGTKHFSGGTKIYCFPIEWGDGYERVRVIGRHRGSARLVTMIIKSAWLVNWRAQKVYNPAIIERLDGAWERSAKYAGNYHLLSPEQHVWQYVKMMKERQDKRENPQA